MGSSALPIARLAINLVASISVSKVVNDIIRVNTNVVTTADAVKVWTGSIVIGSLVAEHASKHVNERIDQVVEWTNKRKEDTEDTEVTEVTEDEPIT